jgi:hypothetical protein
MTDLIRERLPGWGARLSFGMVLLVFSEWVIWQTPTRYTALEWAALGIVYLALAALALDLIVLLNVNDVFSLLLVAGLYGLVNATLISRVTTRDLPISLLVRPLSAQPLAFIGALASFRILASGRATGPLEFVIALVVGFLWGIWVRWFPVVSDAYIPAVKIGPALLALGIGLAACGVLRALLPPTGVYRREDWLLLPVERWAAGGVLLAALVVGAAQKAISRPGVGVVTLLLMLLASMLYITYPLNRKTSFLAPLTPLRRPNLAAWLILIIPFLLAGWIGYRLPGSGDSSPQSDLLFGVLMAFGVVWLPAVSGLIGVRAFIQLSRQGR